MFMHAIFYVWAMDRALGGKAFMLGTEANCSVSIFVATSKVAAQSMGCPANLCF